MIEELEAILETDIEKLGYDFRDLKAFFRFKDGKELEIKYRYELFDITKIRFFVNVTGLDIYKIDGMFFKDKEGKVRIQNNENKK